MNEENKQFNYTYSAKEQAELKRIRQRYLLQENKEEGDKLAKIRRLDAEASRSAMTLSLCVGIIGALVMGFGMSLVMTDLKEFFSLDLTAAMTVGVVTGLVGMTAVIVAYPLYYAVTERKRKKIAPEILRLTDELLNEKK